MLHMLCVFFEGSGRHRNATADQSRLGLALAVTSFLRLLSYSYYNNAVSPITEVIRSLILDDSTLPGGFLQKS